MYLKKILSGLLAFTMAIGLCLPVSAVEINSPSSEEVNITYGMNEGFIVTIPSNFSIDSSKMATVSVSATNVMIAHGSVLEVYISGDDYINSWELVDVEEPANTLTYTIGTEDGLSDIKNNSVVLSVASGVAYNSTVTETLHFTVVDELSKSGEYADTLTFTVDVISGDELEFGEPVHYSSLSAALSDTTQTGDADANTAVVNVYNNTASGRKVIRLQRDVNLTETANIEEILTLDLNGYEITTTVNPAIRTNSEDVIIDGSTPGSAITVTAPTGQGGTVLSVYSGQLVVNGGTYTSNTTNAGTVSSYKYGVYTYADTTLKIDNATIIATEAEKGFINGVHALGDLVVSNSVIIAEADYVGNAAGNNYASSSRGIYSEADTKLYDNYIWGAHSGVASKGTVYVDGGVYEGYGHGAFYLSGSNTTSRFYNAQLNWAPMREGLVSDTVAGTNGAGFYIGGADNVTVYMDNCDFNMNEANGEIYKGTAVPYYGIVFRTSGGEDNNVLYISNSSVGMADRTMFRGAGTSGHTVYNGVGNDWSAATAVHSTNGTYFVNTEDSYSK